MAYSGDSLDTPGADDIHVYFDAIACGRLTREQVQQALLQCREGRFPTLPDAIIGLGFLTREALHDLAQPRETLVLRRDEPAPGTRARARELPPADLALARRVTSALMLDPAKVEECADICRTSPRPVPLSYVLVDRGLVDPQELDELHGAVEASSVGPCVEIIEGPDLGRSFALEMGQRNLVGRGNNVQIPLSDPFVSREHCVIELTDGKPACTDLGSRDGTLISGRTIQGRAELGFGSIVQVGRTRLQVLDKRLDAAPRERGIRIEARNVSKIVRSNDTGKELAILDDISLAIHPGEFVVVLGPSGSGKSTFLDALNGRRRANKGEVLYGGTDFYGNYDLFRMKMGYVPQRDIVHGHLPVRRALDYTAQLRLPSGDELMNEKHLDSILAQLGLTERAKTMIGHLSGGQVKRVSLAVELVSSPSVLFLDEATSGLDAGTERKMMTLFRQIADRGKTVICITHNLENIGQADKVVVLVRGKLVYYAPPEEMTGYFNIPTPSDLYDRLEDGPAEQWEAQFKASSFHEKYVKNRLSRKRPAAPLVTPSKEVSGWRQLRILTQRYFETTIRDWRNLGILIGQAPLIALIASMVFRENSLLLFIMTLTAVWFGCLNASKEIVKELDIYKRERMVNLKLLPYVVSKVVVLVAVSSVQCALLVLIVHARSNLEGGLIPHFLILLNVTTASLMLGLLISSLVGTTDKAISLVPLVLIPQIVFTVYPAVGWRMEAVHKLVAQIAIMAFWAFDALKMTEVQAIAREYGVDYGGEILRGNGILIAFSLVEFMITLGILKNKDRQLVQA